MSAHSAAPSCTSVGCVWSTTRAAPSIVANRRPRRCATRPLPTSAITSNPGRAPTRPPIPPPSASRRPRSIACSANVDGPLRELSALADALRQTRHEPSEGGILFDFHAQMTHAAVIEQLAAAVIKLEVSGAQNLKRLFEGQRCLARVSLHAAAQFLAAAGGGARRR